jgi:hypothetical protein
VKQCKNKRCPKAVIHKQCHHIVLLQHHYAAISSVSLLLKTLASLENDLGFEGVDSPSVKECLDLHAQPLIDTDFIEVE